VTLLVDSHIHVYPCYRRAEAFSILMARIDGQAEKIACLTERHDCDFYGELLESPGKVLGDRFDTAVHSDGAYLRITRHTDGQQLVLLPGRQVVARERLEVIALNQGEFIADGSPATEIIEMVIARGGVPMLPWSPGKWFFERGRIVAELLDRFTPADLLIGDTSLRPRGWPTPRLMGKARRLGYSIVAGSDPLPFPGEEVYFGAYITRIANAPAGPPADRIRRILGNSDLSVTLLGTRPSPFAIARRLHKNAAAKRKS